jgi:hypothetical protein
MVLKKRYILFFVSDTTLEKACASSSIFFVEYMGSCMEEQEKLRDESEVTSCWSIGA